MEIEPLSDSQLKIFRIVASYPRGKIWIIRDAVELQDFFREQKDLNPQIYRVNTWDNCVLTIGFGGPAGFIQHSKSGRPPYRLAVGPVPDDEGTMHFDSGGTLTPIPKMFSLSEAQIEEIVLGYFVNGQLSEDFDWIDI